MDLYDYLRIMRRSWIWIVSLTLAGLLTGAIVTIVTPATYRAETQLFVSIQGSGTIQELQQGNTFGQARVQSYVKTVNTPMVLQPAIESLGLATTAEALAGRVTATNELDTVLIKISVTDGSPVQAAAIAQAISVSLISAVNSLEEPKAGGTSPVSLSVITPATAPTEASAPNTRSNLMLGLLAGLALGVGSAVLRSAMDNRIRGEADLRRATDAPLLGGIAFDQDATRKPLLTQSAPQSPRSESFRQLRTNLQFANLGGQAKTILITSSIPGEGKSTTAANLAIALAQAGQSVCLVDADLRRPSIGEYLGLERDAGLTTALVGSTHLNDLLQAWGEDTLFVLTSGQIPPNPSELLGSEQMRLLILNLEEAFDVVIIDAPPLLPVTDAAVLSRHVGGVVLVAGAQRLKLPELEKALETLALVDARMLGVVLNRVPIKGPDAYGHGYYSYGTVNNNGSGTRGSASRTDSIDKRLPSSVSVPEEDLSFSSVTGAGEDVDLSSVTGAGHRAANTFPKWGRERP